MLENGVVKLGGGEGRKERSLSRWRREKRKEGRDERREMVVRVFLFLVSSSLAVKSPAVAKIMT